MFGGGCQRRWVAGLCRQCGGQIIAAAECVEHNAHRCVDKRGPKCVATVGAEVPKCRIVGLHLVGPSCFVGLFRDGHMVVVLCSSFAFIVAQRLSYCLFVGLAFAMASHVGCWVSSSCVVLCVSVGT